MPAPTAYNRGDPGVYTTYRGSYSFTLAEGATCPSTRILLTNINQVQFCANVDVSSLTLPGVVLTLPEVVRPSEPVHLPGIVEMSDGSFHMCHTVIATNGELSVDKGFFMGETWAPKTFYLDSLQYDLASDVYGS